MNIQNLMLAMLLQVVVTGCASNGSVPLPAKTSAADSEIVTLLYVTRAVHKVLRLLL